MPIFLHQGYEISRGFRDIAIQRYTALHILEN